ncbi:putative phosphatidylinositol kinase L615 [Phytophthora ramorum]|uniref:putative phosphatidylinositol kinase L615 n=1 Tax=Phytophthora ramorum TaxID=164328 RepID=UPI0030976FFC|nr:putative phosphatidylinositol kinase L615 [Phytophthora ramorum]
MYSHEPSAIDLSFSQVLEARSTLHEQQRRRRKPPPANGRVPRPLNTQVRRFPVLETQDAGPPAYGSGLLDSVYEGSEDILEESEEDREAGTEDEEWTNGDDGQLGQDMYRFVQPRRLSSWVQDDAVFACFKCHTVFSLLIRKHHCRACGRIFCSACSSQRVVIPGDYEATPVAPAYNALSTNASDLIGNIGWYLTSYSSPNAAGVDLSGSGTGRHSFNDSGSWRFSHEEQQEKFLKDVQRLQETNVISKFTPNRSRSGSASSSLSSSGATTAPSAHRSVHVPDGSVMQRVCDDCACALQQRRHHYNTVKVFELCEFDLQELRTLGQVCRKWHRATIMCLSMFRQIQYYLPTHRLSEREKKMLIINRKK